MGLLNFPAYYLTALFHDWIPVKENVVLNSAISNKTERPILLNILTIISKETKTTGPQVSIKSPFRKINWKRSFIGEKFVVSKGLLFSCFATPFPKTILNKTFFHESMSISKSKRPIEIYSINDTICGFVQTFEGLPNKGFGYLYDGDRNGTFFGEVERKSETSLWKAYSGLGSLISSDARGYATKLSGLWKNGELNGFGTKTLREYRYKGYFVDGLMEGDGVIEHFRSGRTISGTWLKGILVNETFDFPQGFYTGSFEVDFSSIYQHGTGEMKFTNGDVYIGMFLSGHCQGEGKMMFVNGAVYEGSWVNDKPSGNGVLTSPNGEKYTGSFSQGCKHGEGEMIFEKGEIYVGNWLNGMCRAQ